MVTDPKKEKTATDPVTDNVTKNSNESQVLDSLFANVLADDVTKSQEEADEAAEIMKMRVEALQNSEGYVLIGGPEKKSTYHQLTLQQPKFSKTLSSNQLKNLTIIYFCGYDPEEYKDSLEHANFKNAKVVKKTMADYVKAEGPKTVIEMLNKIALLLKKDGWTRTFYCYSAEHVTWFKNFFTSYNEVEKSFILTQKENWYVAE